MHWRESWRASPSGAALADRHYNRQAVGSAQFVPPGRCYVLEAEQPGNPARVALWVTSWPLPEFTKHAWAGAWVNSTFRNEGAGLSSELIRDAVAATRSHWPEVPELGMVTMVDPAAVRHKRDPGRCYMHAGFKLVGQTRERGHLVFQLLPHEMPGPVPAFGAQGRLL